MQKISNCVKSRNFSILQRAKDNSDKILAASQKFSGSFLTAKKFETDKMCFAAVGSVGRKEALEASDLDIVPIATNDESLKEYMCLDEEFRSELGKHLGIKVSKGEDLTKATSITKLVEVDTIGGSADTRSALTRRVLLLTESAHAGGGMPIGDIRRELVNAYAGEDRTSGRHVLSLCNDIARYFKTLCIEYKAKIEEEEKDWCTRNMKLRHSRKIWYFANIMAVSTLANMHPKGDEEFIDALLKSFNTSPIERLADALEGSQPLGLGRLLESYALFLDFMSSKDNRSSLSCVNHANRYKMSSANAFLPMKFNSDLVHNEIMSIMEELGPATRSRIVGWFML